MTINRYSLVLHNRLVIGGNKKEDPIKKKRKPMLSGMHYVWCDKRGDFVIYKN